MPNYANGAKKKKPKPKPDAASASDNQKPKGPVDPADMAALLAAKKAAKAAAGAKKEPKKTASQKLAEYQASEAERRRKEKEARDKIAKKAAERVREAELAATKRRLEKERAVESLSLDDDPQAIAQCVARTLGIQGAGVKPKDILAKAVEKMPDVPLAEGLPKEQLMQLVGVLVERRAAKRAGEAERAAAAKATAKAEQDEQRAAAEERARAKAEEAAEAKRQVDARVAEKLALQQRDPNRAERLQKRDESAAADSSSSDYTLNLTKEQLKAAKRAEAMAAAVTREAQLLESEMAAARQASARARTAGDQQAALGTIETGEFSLPNPGGGPDLLDQASLVLVPGRRYGLIGRNGKVKKRHFCAIYTLNASSFYQDRLGTNIGKTQKRVAFLSLGQVHTAKVSLGAALGHRRAPDEPVDPLRLADQRGRHG
jgi:hypothetical protein